MSAELIESFRQRIAKLEAENIDLAKLLIANCRPPTFNARMMAEAAQAGMPVEAYRLDWIRTEQNLRSQAIQVLRRLIASAEKLLPSE